MARNIVTGIDVGSSHIRVVISEYVARENAVRFLAITKTKSAGLKHGHIVNASEVRDSIRESVAEATKVSGVKVSSALVAASGVALGTHTDSGSVAVSRADKEVSDLDINRILSESEIRASSTPNDKVIHTIPYEYKLDGRKVIGNPIGLKGSKLEIKTLFITCVKSHLEDLTKAVEGAGVEVEDIFAAPVAESLVTLTNPQKHAGCVIANIGASTVTTMTIEDSLPSSLKVFPIGSNDITNDIALGLKIPLEEAEEIKKRYSYHDDRRMQKKVMEIIEARLTDVFELIDTHLRKIGRSNLLPAGIIFTGEGAGIEDIERLAKERLGLPARVGENLIYNGGQLATEGDPRDTSKQRERHEKIKSPEWSVAYGLCVLGMEMESEESIGIKMVRKTKNRFFSFLKQLLP